MVLRLNLPRREISKLSLCVLEISKLSLCVLEISKLSLCVLFGVLRFIGAFRWSCV